MHGDDIGRHNPRVSRIHNNTFVFDATGQVDGEQSQCQLRVAIYRNAPKATLPSPEEKIRKVKMTDGIRTRYHIHNTAPLSHQWQQLAGQQVRPYIIDTHRPFQSVFGNAAFRFHGSGIVHQQRQRLSPLQQMLCKCGH